MTSWVYFHQDLDEPPYPDGSRVLRPAVPLVVSPGLPSVLEVLDSGSPASVANAKLFGELGVDIDRTEPLYEIALTVGGRFTPTPVFEIELWLHPPGRGTEPFAWSFPSAPAKAGCFPSASSWDSADGSTDSPRRGPLRGDLTGEACSRRSAQLNSAIAM